MPARSTRWRRACCCSASAARHGCSTYLVGCDKGYDATIRLGQATVTDDAEGDVTTTADASGVGREALDAAVARLTGDLQQVPSSVSAIKVDGKRSYARVRGGEEVALAARPVTVSRFDVLDVRADGAVVDVDVRVEVSSGTYVRALARDLGADLGVGGHLTALRRTRVGRFGVASARPLDELVAGAEAAVAAGRERADVVPLLSMGDAARAQFPERVLTEDEERSVRYGQRIDAVRRGEPIVAAVDGAGELVALLDETREQAKSLVVFPTV